MAYGQIDPARLEGDALRRWYLRSPADIEDEQRRAADDRYDAFFRPAERLGDDSESSGDNDDAAAPSSAGVVWTQVGDRRWRGERTPSSGFTALAAPGTGVDTAASSMPATCVNCHGHVPPPPIPPPFGAFPWPIGPFPTFRGTPRSSSRGGGGEHPKQCDQQYDRDSGICRNLDDAEDRANCWSSASNRLAYCIGHGGEIGSPRLNTGNR